MRRTSSRCSGVACRGGWEQGLAQAATRTRRGPHETWAHPILGQGLRAQERLGRAGTGAGRQHLEWRMLAAALPSVPAGQRLAHPAQHPSSSAPGPPPTLWSSSGGSCRRPLPPLALAPPAGACRCRRFGPLPMPAGPLCPNGAWLCPLAAPALLLLVLAGSAARFTRASRSRPWRETWRGT